MEDKIAQVMASVFGIERAALGADASPQSIEQWDSLHHMNLVVALEEEFGVRFTESQIDEMLSLRLIAIALEELGAKA